MKNPPILPTRVQGQADTMKNPPILPIRVQGQADTMKNPPILPTRVQGQAGAMKNPPILPTRVQDQADTTKNPPILPIRVQGRVLSLAIYGLANGIGVLAFIYPFLAPSLETRANDAPLALTALVALCFVVLLLEAQGQSVNAKFVALLGILVSMNAVLRFLEVAIPGPGGFSPTFFLIVLTGYVYGGRFGFLMGALTLLVSALVTGAVGPWLPYQMFTASWVGMSAPLCRPLVRLGKFALSSCSSDFSRWKRLKSLLPTGFSRLQFEIIVLACFAGLWGLLYGGITNVSFWPYASGPTDQYWQAGISLSDTLRRYAAFYVTTSLAWDAMRALGNVLLILAFGAPTLRVLRRFQRRFAFSYRPAHEPEATASIWQTPSPVGER